MIFDDDDLGILGTDIARHSLYLVLSEMINAGLKVIKLRFDLLLFLLKSNWGHG